jgi:hypothetical protein
MQISHLFHRSLFAAVLAACAWVMPAAANDNCPSCAPSRASAESTVFSSAVIVSGSMYMLKESGRLVVTGIKAVPDGVVVVLKGVSDATTLSVKLTGQAAGSLSAAVGTVVEVVAGATGSMLVIAGQAIAFIPNEIGTALLHQSQVQAKK